MQDSRGRPPIGGDCTPSGCAIGVKSAPGRRDGRRDAGVTVGVTLGAYTAGGGGGWCALRARGREPSGGAGERTTGGRGGVGLAKLEL